MMTGKSIPHSGYRHRRFSCVFLFLCDRFLYFYNLYYLLPDFFDFYRLRH